jgi:hypothetical protein
MSIWEYTGMAQIKEYIIIEETLIGSMNARIESYIVKGYRPHGSVSYTASADLYLQGMILYEGENFI